MGRLASRPGSLRIKHGLGFEEGESPTESITAPQGNRREATWVSPCGGRDEQQAKKGKDVHQGRCQYERGTDTIIGSSKKGKEGRNFRRGDQEREAER